MKPARHIAPRGAHRQALRQLRILVLLVVLFIVAVGTWRDHARSTQWRVPLFVALYPIAADSSAVTQRYVASLRGAQFADIDAFFATQAHHYGVALPVPLQIRLKDALQVLPPARAAEDGPLKTLLWSLRLRYWAWRQTRAAREPADVRLFVLYHDPAQAATLPHSSGLQKGMIGVVHAFALADMQGSNNVVIAHEIMHTLGAGDKYDAMNDAPLFPQGYGDPTQSPLYPQRFAELMAGRRMLSADHWETPASLAEVRIGPASAAQIRWSPHAP